MMRITTCACLAIIYQEVIAEYCPAYYNYAHKLQPGFQCPSGVRLVGLSDFYCCRNDYVSDEVYCCNDRTQSINQIDVSYGQEWLVVKNDYVSDEVYCCNDRTQSINHSDISYGQEWLVVKNDYVSDEVYCCNDRTQSINHSDVSYGQEWLVVNMPILVLISMIFGFIAVFSLTAPKIAEMKENESEEV